MKKRLFAGLLALCMTVNLMSATAFAEETSNAAEETTCVAKIGEEPYETLKAALTAAENGETITLVWTEDSAPIDMNGEVYGKTVTITGSATVDWSKGFLFVGRGGKGDGTVIFDNAKLTSCSNSSSYGIHVSGREKNTNNKYDGTVLIQNSTIELDYLINKGAMTLDNSTLTVKNGFAVGGRPGTETESGEDAIATMTLNNGSNLVVNNHNGMGLGYEAIGIMNVNDSSEFTCTQSFLVKEKGTMNISSNASVEISEDFTVNGKLVIDGTGKTAGEYGNITRIVKGSNATIEVINNDTLKAKVEDGKIVLAQLVASVGDKKYETLQDAFVNVKDGETIYVVDDITITTDTAAYNDGTYIDGVRYTGDKSFTVDFGGFTVTDDGCVNDYLIYLNNKENGAKANEITFQNGTIASKEGCWSTICVGATNSVQKTVLNLNGMNIVNSNAAEYAGNLSVRVRGNELAENTVNVNLDTVIVSNGAAYGIACATSNSAININSGSKVKQENSGASGGNNVYTAVGGKGVINIREGAEITSDLYGIHTMTTGTPVVHIYGGTITATKSALVASTNGGEGELATINVYGGTINGALEEKNSDSVINVSGGVYNVDPTNYLITGYEVVEKDSNYKVDKHEPKAVSATSPSCSSTGTSAHYKCDFCGRLYSDASGAANKEVTASSLEIAAKGHSYSKKYDSSSHWLQCSVCGKVKDDASHSYSNGKCSCGHTVKVEVYVPETPAPAPAPTPAPETTTTTQTTTQTTTTTKPVEEAAKPVETPVEEVVVDTKIVKEVASEEVKEAVKETVTVAETKEVEKETGTVTEVKVAVTTETVDKVIGNTEAGATVILPLTEVAEEGQAVTEAEVAVEALEKIVEAEAALTVEFEGVKVTFESETIKAIAEQAQGSTIELRVVPVDHHELNEEQQAVLEEHDVAVRVSAQIFSDGEYIGDFKGGKATIAIPFTPEEGKAAEDHKVYFVDDNGEMTLMPAVYVDGHMVFETNHFSDYVIVYEEVAEAEVEEEAAVEEEAVVETVEEETEKAGLPIVPIIIIVVAIILVVAFVATRKRNDEE